MELVFSRKEMVKVMGMVSRVAGKPAILPVLSHVLISAGRDSLWDTSDGDRIYVAATDLEVGTRTKIPGQVVETGAITLPARTFASVISSLAEEEVRLIASGDRARICCDKGEFKMVGMPADEFPSLSLMGEAGQNSQLELTDPSPGDEKEKYLLSLDSDVLEWMIRKTSFAASRDDARYFLNGVHLSLKPEGDGTLVRMAATDGTRLAVASASIEEALESVVEAIIPNRAVKELERLTGSSEFPARAGIRIGVQDNRMVFDAGDTALVSALIEGDYPDYERVIPDESKINLKADTGHLLAVIRRISQVSDPKLPCVKLEMAGSRMKVSASSPHVGDGCEEMDVEKEGDDIGIAVNARYLMDALRAIETQETLIGINGAVLPVVIKPSSGDHLCVLMPIRVTDNPRVRGDQPPTVPDCNCQGSGAGAQEGDET